MIFAFQNHEQKQYSSKQWKTKQRTCFCWFSTDSSCECRKCRRYVLIASTTMQNQPLTQFQVLSYQTIFTIEHPILLLRQCSTWLFWYTFKIGFLSPICMYKNWHEYHKTLEHLLSFRSISWRLLIDVVVTQLQEMSTVHFPTVMKIRTRTPCQVL